MAVQASEKVVLLTGASGGIGRAIALRLSADGMRLAMCGRNAGRLQETAGATGRADEHLILVGDLTDEAHLAACVRRTVEAYGHLDALVNCAGLAMNKPLEETTAEEYDRIMSINARTPYLLCRLALPELRRSQEATIVNIGSVVAHTGYAMQSAYTASKHALLGMTRALAKEVWRDGIRVHIVSPGGVDTDMIRVARPDLAAGMIPPETVADTVSFLIGFRGRAVIDEIQMHREGKEPFLT